MSKEIERLKSKLEFCKALINLYEGLNFIDKSNKVEEYKNRLSELYKRMQELKKEGNQWNL